MSLLSLELACFMQQVLLLLHGEGNKVQIKYSHDFLHQSQLGMHLYDCVALVTLILKVDARPRAATAATVIHFIYYIRLYLTFHG